MLLLYRLCGLFTDEV